nr:MAG TPA: hypothetical protein [Caudoviricetes sp.]
MLLKLSLCHLMMALAVSRTAAPHRFFVQRTLKNVHIAF